MSYLDQLLSSTNDQKEKKKKERKRKKRGGGAYDMWQTPSRDNMHEKKSLKGMFIQVVSYISATGVNP